MIIHARVLSHWTQRTRPTTMESVPENDGIIEFSFTFVISVHVGDDVGWLPSASNQHSYKTHIGVVGQPYY